MVACDTVDPNDCYVNTSGGFGASGPIPIGAGVGVSSGGDQLSPPRFGSLDYPGPANPCVTGGSETKQPAPSPSPPVMSTPQQAAINALNQADPHQVAWTNAVAVYAAEDCSYVVQSQTPDPAMPNEVLVAQLFNQCQATAGADAQAWGNTVDPSTVPTGPFGTYDLACLDPPYSCPVGQVCPLGDGVYCTLTACGSGKCPQCPFWGNLLYDGYCTYACVQAGKLWGYGVRLNTRWGAGEFFCLPLGFKG